MEVRYKGYTPNDKQQKKPRDLTVSLGYSLTNNDVFEKDATYTNRVIKFDSLIPNGRNLFVAKYVTDDGKLSLVNQTQWLNLPITKTDDPITFVATVLETRKAGRFAKFASNTFTSSKQGITDAATTAVTQLEIFKASAALQQEKVNYETAELANKEVYFKAITLALDTKEELDALCKLEKPPAKTKIRAAQTTLYSAQRKADIAAILAKEKPLYEGSKTQIVTGECD